MSFELSHVLPSPSASIVTQPVSAPSSKSNNVVVVSPSSPPADGISQLSSTVSPTIDAVNDLTGAKFSSAAFVHVYSIASLGPPV